MLIGFPPFLVFGRYGIKETDRLTTGERRFFFAYLKTGKQIDAYALAFPLKQLKKPEVAACKLMKRIKAKYDWNRLLNEVGLGYERILSKLEELLEAKYTKFYQDQELGDFTDNGTRMRALELLTDLHGLRKQILEHQGTITFTEAIIQNYENRKLRLVGKDEHGDSGTN